MSSTRTERGVASQSSGGIPAGGGSSFIALLCPKTSILSSALISPLNSYLLDMMMPRMNGWEFLRALETYPELNRIPVIVLSAQTIQPQQAATGNVVTHLTKPIDLERLLSLVDRVYQTGA
jgi:CheY-like chemotaxis protein